VDLHGTEIDRLRLDRLVGLSTWLNERNATVLTKKSFDPAGDQLPVSSCKS